MTSATHKQEGKESGHLFLPYLTILTPEQHEQRFQTLAWSGRAIAFEINGNAKG